ncbi:hypothetical protein UJ101_00854 [Flavobacteriaceae bacterium UJ101]|nr:hypothetical protein UJ101_00854 [Flavobacteriaceae bacterium UJ101]
MVIYILYYVKKEEKYIELAVSHGKAWVEGDDKEANKIHGKLMKLKETNDLALEDLLNHENESVKLWSAIFLLDKKNEQAVQTLQDIKDNGTSMSSTAMIMLDMWKKGML